MMTRPLVDKSSKFRRVEFETHPLIMPPGTFIGTQLLNPAFLGVVSKEITQWTLKILSPA